MGREYAFQDWDLEGRAIVRVREYGSDGTGTTVHVKVEADRDDFKADDAVPLNVRALADQEIAAGRIHKPAGKAPPRAGS